MCDCFGLHPSLSPHSCAQNMAIVMMIAMMVMIVFGMYDNGDHIGVVMMMRMMTRLIDNNGVMSSPFV